METPEITSELRHNIIRVPEVIESTSGIRIFGRCIRSILFSTDIAIIRNCNADAVIAVYPFTPQPAIAQAILQAANVPVFCGIGGGTTTGKRVTKLAQEAEFQGALGVVLNSPTTNETLYYVSQHVEIPAIITVVSPNEDVDARLRAGASILNVSGAADTARIVRAIREKYPTIPIMATGGRTDESIRATIEAGANAITYTPPTTASLFTEMMIKYRKEIAPTEDK